MSEEDANDWRAQGEALLEQGRFEEALAAFDKALRLDDRFAPAYVGKGDTLKAMGRPLEAEGEYVEARKLHYRW